jgi:hypothetical protein
MSRCARSASMLRRSDPAWPRRGGTSNDE